MILASKTGSEPALPPPSPVQLAKNPSLRSDIAPLNSPSGRPSFSNSNPEPTPELSAFRNRIASIEKRGGDPSVSAPVQRMGDEWLASSVIASSEPKRDGDVFIPQQTRKVLGEIQNTPSNRDSAADLRDSVAQMFDDSHPSPNLHFDYSDDMPLAVSRRETPMDRVAQWQQPGTHHLSVFGRSKTPTFPPTEVDLRKTDTILSFDPNDLNPSRSASQVRRTSTVAPAPMMEPTTTAPMGMSVPRYRHGEALTILEEVSDSMSMQSPTHVSHVTFPKPAVGMYGGPTSGNSAGIGAGGRGRYMTNQPLSPHLEMAESSSISSRTGTSLQTPHTAPESMVDDSRPMSSRANSLGHEPLDTDASTLSRQVDGMHGDVRKVVGALTALVAASQFDRLEDSSKGIDDKLATLSLDVKAIENALNLSSLAEKGPPSLEKENMDDKLPELHRKLDGIAKVCEELLSRGVAPTREVPLALTAGAAGVGAAVGSTMDSVAMARDASKASTSSTGSARSQSRASAIANAKAKANARKGSLGITHDEREEKEAGEEVAAIMAELVSVHDVREG